MGPVVKAVWAVGPEAGEPLVAGLAGDVEEGAEVGEVERAGSEGVQKALAFVHG